MYKKHPNFKSPANENAKIWRYMDFTKFTDMLDRSALYFVRVDKLQKDDPFEGSYPKINIDLIEAGRGIIPKEKLISFSGFIKYLRKRVSINSWHINENESAAMWKLYLKSNEGIAILSTFKRLKKSFTDENSLIFIGKVKYINYDKDSIKDTNIFSLFLHKRKSLEHERELRAVLVRRKQTEKKGTAIDISRVLSEHELYVPTDLNMLIEDIYLAPGCPKWMSELVTSVTHRYRLDKRIIPSNLDASPLF